MSFKIASRRPAKVQKRISAFEEADTEHQEGDDIAGSSSQAANEALAVSASKWIDKVSASLLLVPTACPAILRTLSLHLATNWSTAFCPVALHAASVCRRPCRSNAGHSMAVVLFEVALLVTGRLIPPQEQLLCLHLHALRRWFTTTCVCMHAGLWLCGGWRCTGSTALLGAGRPGEAAS
jgi:hypothetical protein